MSGMWTWQVTSLYLQIRPTDSCLLLLLPRSPLFVFVYQRNVCGAVKDGHCLKFPPKIMSMVTKNHVFQVLSVTWSSTLVQTGVSQNLLYRFPWIFVQTFMITSGWTWQTNFRVKCDYFGNPQVKTFICPTLWLVMKSTSPVLCGAKQQVCIRTH